MPLTTGALPLREGQAFYRRLRPGRKIRHPGHIGHGLGGHHHCQTLGIQPPYLVTIGDTGHGRVATIKILDHLTKELSNLKPAVLTLHYLLPTKEPFLKLIDAVWALEPRPFFVADAGRS